MTNTNKTYYCRLLNSESTSVIKLRPLSTHVTDIPRDTDTFDLYIPTSHIYHVTLIP